MAEVLDLSSEQLTNVLPSYHKQKILMTFLYYPPRKFVRGSVIHIYILFVMFPFGG